jgi:hypothetical protein
MGAFVNRLWQQASEPDKEVVSQLTRPEKLRALPLTSPEFVKAFTSDKK